VKIDIDNIMEKTFNMALGLARSFIYWRWIITISIKHSPVIIIMNLLTDKSRAVELGADLDFPRSACCLNPFRAFGTIFDLRNGN